MAVITQRPVGSSPSSILRIGGGLRDTLQSGYGHAGRVRYTRRLYLRR